MHDTTIVWWMRSRHSNTAVRFSLSLSAYLSRGRNSLLTNLYSMDGIVRVEGIWGDVTWQGGLKHYVYP